MGAACSLAIGWHLWARTSSALVGRQKELWCKLRGRLALWLALCGLVNTEFSEYILGSLASNERNKPDVVLCPPSAGHSNISLILLVEHVSVFLTSGFPLFTLCYSFSLSRYWKLRFPILPSLLLLIFRDCEPKSTFTYKPFIMPLILVMVCKIYTSEPLVTGAP